LPLTVSLESLRYVHAPACAAACPAFRRGNKNRMGGRTRRRERPATREGAVEFRCALEELWPTFIKLGQLLSSRPDREL
jgi:predicted unusual protein kinase regulating ubiquinone biosynthesis (AarF/ABC1/UbiB family)